MVSIEQAESATRPEAHALDRPASTLWRREAWLVAGILALAAGARIARWAVTAVMFNDGPVFLALAKALAAGDWQAALAHPFHPLYPLSIVAAQAVVPDWETAAVAVSILAGTAAVGCLYAFVRAAFGRAAGSYDQGKTNRRDRP